MNKYIVYYTTDFPRQSIYYGDLDSCINRFANCKNVRIYNERGTRVH